jgi:hypothetical protein
MTLSMKAIAIPAALALSVATASLAQAPGADPTKLEFFSRGIGSNQFGMTLDQIDAIQHYQKVRWTNLPIAREYSPVEVRYFFQPLASFDCSAASTCELFSVFRPCWTKQTFVVFFFTQDEGLIRISIRLSPPCPSSESLQNFASSFGIAPFDGRSSSAFKTALGRTVLEGRIDTRYNWATLDVYNEGSPLPR